MARTIRDTNLGTRSARLDIPTSRKPVWRSVEQGLALGYRRGTRGGVWFARGFFDGAYAVKKIGTADDKTDADGDAVLSYNDALYKARNWWQREKRHRMGLQGRTGPYTVRRACEDYLEYYVGKGGKDEYNVRRCVETHILPKLGDKDVSILTTRTVRDWHHALARSPRLLRTSKLAEMPNLKEVDPNDADAVRARRSSANRILTVLKAALNHAYNEREVGSDEAWRSVKPFRNVDAPVIRYLTTDECKHLVNTCPPDLRRLVQAALLSGARYGELIQLKAGDINTDSGMMLIRDSKSGKPRHAVLTDEAVALFSQWTAGKLPDDFVFLRSDGNRWKASQQTMPMSEACKRVGVEPAIGFHILRHTHASTLAMQGVPMAVIAEQLGHSDTRMTERHYAHLSPSYVAQTIRAHFPDLGISDKPSVSRVSTRASK